MTRLILPLCVAALLGAACDSAVPEELIPSLLRYDELDGVPDAALADHQEWTVWKRATLRWYLSLHTSGEAARMEEQVVAEAFEAWDGVASLRLHRVFHPDSADIVFVIRSGTHCPLAMVRASCLNVEHPDSIVGHTWQRTGREDRAEIQIQPSEELVGSGHPEQALLLGAALHHIGHALGLGHSTYDLSVMYPMVRAEAIPAILSRDDERDLQRLYGPPGSVPKHWVLPLTVPSGERDWCISARDPAPGDLDGDGLGDALEVYVLGTDPRNCDSDIDDLGDQEILIGLNPWSIDTDDDMTTDGLEIARGTSPYVPTTWYNRGPATGRRSVLVDVDEVGPIQVAFEVSRDPIAVDALLATGFLRYDWNGATVEVPVRGGVVRSGQVVMASADFHFRFVWERSGEGSLRVGEREFVLPTG